jgi:pimeloyl-ACP methyl ester carboxylesterase
MSTSVLTPRRCLVPAALLAGAIALTGCGIGAKGNQERISGTAVTYLHALADGNTAKACAELTVRARGRACPASLRRRLARLDAHALDRAADASMDIHVDGATATARLSEPDGARLVLRRRGSDWRIDSGYTVAAAARIPETPVGREISWAIAQLDGAAASLTETQVAARFSPEFLATAMPASGIIASLRQEAARRGPFTFTGFASPPTATQAIALIRSRTGERGSVRVRIDGATPARIVAFDVMAAPPILTSGGRYSGSFDIGGRRLFLHCTGSGGPTVVFQGGLTVDWMPVQTAVSRMTRACSYDPANGAWGRSDPAPTPRSAADVDADLHALLHAARVPGPYVLVGHSNAGLFAQLYAALHPRQVAGLVLIDAVHPSYYERQMALLRHQVSLAQWKVEVHALRTPQPVALDPEQIDMFASQAQARAALAAHPLQRMPLFVLTRGRPEPSPASQRKIAQDEHLWHQLQDELAALVPHSRHLVVPHTGHDIQTERPAVVVRAIAEVVRGVRDPDSWTRR